MTCFVLAIFCLVVVFVMPFGNTGKVDKQQTVQIRPKEKINVRTHVLRPGQNSGGQIFRYKRSGMPPLTNNQGSGSNFAIGEKPIIIGDNYGIGHTGKHGKHEHHDRRH